MSETNCMCGHEAPGFDHMEIEHDGTTKCVMPGCGCKQYRPQTLPEIAKAISLLREGIESTGTSTLHHQKMSEAVEVLTDPRLDVLTAIEKEALAYAKGYQAGLQAQLDQKAELLAIAKDSLKVLQTLNVTYGAFTGPIEKIQTVIQDCERL